MLFDLLVVLLASCEHVRSVLGSLVYATRHTLVVLMMMDQTNSIFVELMYEGDGFQ